MEKEFQAFVKYNELSLRPVTRVGKENTIYKQVPTKAYSKYLKLLSFEILSSFTIYLLDIYYVLNFFFFYCQIIFLKLNALKLSRFGLI